MIQEAILTEAKFEQAQSSNGGWSKKQLEVLGVDWPPKKGWKRKLIGKPMRKKKVDEFIRLKDEHI